MTPARITNILVDKPASPEGQGIIAVNDVATNPTI
jgi:hypothetical protein